MLIKWDQSVINSSCLNNIVGSIQPLLKIRWIIHQRRTQIGDTSLSSVTVLKTVVGKISPRRDGGIEVAAWGSEKRETLLL